MGLVAASEAAGRVLALLLLHSTVLLAPKADVGGFEAQEIHLLEAWGETEY